MPSGIRHLEPYRKNYLLIRHTSNINKSPSSPSPDHTVQTPYPYQKVEIKFQFSVKSEIGNYRDLEFLGFKNFRLWGAFTQQSYWQAFNVGASSPFRESNYEPELIGTFGTGNAQGWKLLNLGLSHQSNGRSNPDSRSWNRLYLQGGWEWDDIYVMGRGWWRIPENPAKDDNPDLTQYVGRAELVIALVCRIATTKSFCCCAAILIRTDTKVFCSWTGPARSESASLPSSICS